MLLSNLQNNCAESIQKVKYVDSLIVTKEFFERIIKRKKRKELEFFLKYLENQNSTEFSVGKNNKVKMINLNL